MTKKGMLGRLSVYAMLLCASLTANAVPVVYDFTGTGVLNTYTGEGRNYVTEEHSFFGTVTIDVLLSEAPFSNPPTSANGNGWVDAQFDINWDDGSFRPADNAGPRFTFTELWNTPFQDELLVQEWISQPGSGRRTSATLQRLTDDATWLTDLSFVHQGLAPGSYNRINFEDVPSSNQGPGLGFWGRVDLSSLTIRSASVPEPATLGLFGLGLVGSLFARRTRKR